MLLTPLWQIDLLLLLSTIIFLFIKYLSRNYDYWEKRKIFYVKPQMIFGNFYEMFAFRMNIGEYLSKFYNMTAEPFFGIFVFSTPHFVLRSPEVIKHIMVKDFQYFSDRTVYAGDHEIMSKHMLFVNKSPEWKTMRTKITPVFTSGKLKNMLPLISGVAERMKDYIRKEVLHLNYVDIREICAKYATDVLAKCAFAIDAHSFDDENAEFRKAGKVVFDIRWTRAVQQTSAFFTPTLSKLFGWCFIDNAANGFLRDVFWEALEEREKSGIKRHDLIDTIIELRKNEKFCKEMKFEKDKVVAQAGQFFAAGFETTSSTIGFTLYELCLHPDIQSRLREEIISTYQKYGEFTYENIQEMKYLHMCISETLRMYPVLPFLDRICNTNYKIPGYDVVIEKDTPVYIPMIGLHYDPEYFPNPQKYNPERFSEENINQIVPFSYFPFGEGPRNCIGERFGLMVTKLGLIHLLLDFEVERTKETPVPLEFEPKSFVLAPKAGLSMKVKPIGSGSL